jgi:hypothetical protein
MFNLQFTQEAMAMTDARPQFVSGRVTLRAALLLPAAALIFIGSVFQLGMLGYGQLNPRDLWPALMLVQSAWNLAAAHLNAPDLAAVSQFWPLLLVVLGLAIFLAVRPKSFVNARNNSRSGDQ